MLFCFAIANCQNVFVINLKDNTSVSTPFSNIQWIKFNGDYLLLKSTTGNENSYLLDNIVSVTFSDEIGIKEFTETIDVNIFINVFGEIVAESPHQINKLIVFDLTGRQVAISSQSRMNINALPSGPYILQVDTDKGFVNKKFIKNR
jgi:hypothetical protein